MPKTDDQLDELPILDPRPKQRRAEPAPPVRTFNQAITQVMRLRRKAVGRKRGGPRGGHPNRGSQAAAVRPSLANSRRVTVKGRYVKQTSATGAKKVRLHVKYIERDGVSEDGGRGVLYNEDKRELSSDDFLQRAKEDPHQFRFIVSPEEGADLDLTAYTRDLMSQIEKDLGRELDWAAVNHYNTENPHTHIVIRGRDKRGKELRMDREYISNGIRDRARELATRELGVRLEHEIVQGLAREIHQERYTSIDWHIERCSHENLLPSEGGRSYTVALGDPGDVVPLNRDRFVVGRLNALKKMGLARQGSHGRSYELNGDWKAQLHALGERGDIYKRLSRISRDARERRIFDPVAEPGDVVGRLSGKGSHDELYDRYYAVVEESAGAARYVRLPQSVDVDKLPTGGIVRVRSIVDPWRKPADEIIAQYARRHGGIYDQAAHARSLAADRAFMARGIDPQDYALAHGRRAARLARFGLVNANGSGAFVIPEDLRETQSILERNNPNPRIVRVEVIDERTLGQQVTAVGPSWLDTQGAGEETARNGFGEEVSAALARRAEFLKTLDIEESDPKKVQKLQRLERIALGDAYAAQSGKKLQPLAANTEGEGVLKRKLVAPSGKVYGVFESEREFSLVPWRDRWQQNIGRRMLIGMDTDGVPFGRVLGRGLQR